MENCYEDDKWLDWAMELQSIAQAGLFYCKDQYDIERFERIREISAEMVSRIGISITCQDMHMESVRFLYYAIL